jgi:hypothetical protein
MTAPAPAIGYGVLPLAKMINQELPLDVPEHIQIFERIAPKPCTEIASSAKTPAISSPAFQTTGRQSARARIVKTFLSELAEIGQRRKQIG